MDELKLKELDIRDDFTLHAEMCEVYGAWSERIMALQAEDTELKVKRQGVRIKERREEIRLEIATIREELVEPMLASEFRNQVLGKLCRTISVAEAEIEELVEKVRNDPVHQLSYRTDDLVEAGLQRAHYGRLREDLAENRVQDWDAILGHFQAEAVRKVMRGAESRKSRSTSQQSNLVEDIELEWWAMMISRPSRWTTFSEVVWEYNRCAKIAVFFDDVSLALEMGHEDDWDKLIDYR